MVDMPKAFDTIDIGKLVTGLRGLKLTVSPEILNLLTFYLYNRKQFLCHVGLTTDGCALMQAMGASFKETEDIESVMEIEEEDVKDELLETMAEIDRIEESELAVPLKDLLKMIREIVRTLKKSPVNYSIYLQLCGSALRLDVPTRWHSLIDMLDSIIKNGQPLKQTCDKLKVTMHK
ncbi:hypothetical protein Ciccas_008031 [Cichlidogyrus casuarinus]|uniref:Reverse transcriptase domain-containing protein n=1 Tax=Cichlidogyrus casuarinus TaxID=1844966 RepID=A0ABD2Q155_9PLAT